MRKIILLLIIVVQHHLLFSQRIGLTCEQDPCSCVKKNYINNDLIKAKYYCDKCILIHESRETFIQPWFMRGLVYQKIYEKNDTIFHIAADDALTISINSYVKTFCINVVNDTLNSERLINDSTYRIGKINIFGTYKFKYTDLMLELKDSILPNTLIYLKKCNSIDSKLKYGYVLIFEGIIKQTNIELEPIIESKKRK